MNKTEWDEVSLIYRKQNMLNIYQRLNEVRKKVDYVRKEKAVENYKAITHDQLTAILRPYLIEYGIVFVPNLKSTVTVQTGTATSKGTPIIRAEVEYFFDVVNVDDPSDKFTCLVSAHANDFGDKAPGKAFSYAKKALELKLFDIETGEDEESRYQQTEFDVVGYVDRIRAAGDLDALKAVYVEAFGAANDAKDKDAMKAITKAKDERKKVLQGTSNG